MDLRIYARVIWRFRLIVAIGFALALALALLSYTKVSFKNGKPTVSYRQSETWKATTMIFMTQAGFPWGRAVTPYTPTASGGYNYAFADPGRLSSLGVYYGQLANSDPVQRLLHQRVRVPGGIFAVPITDPNYHYPEPFVAINGLGHSARDAVALANGGANALIAYIKQQQDAAGIPNSQRVTPQVISAANGAILSAARRKTAPVVIFLTVLIASIGLAFILENLRPRVRLVGEASQEPDMPLAGSQRGA